MSNEEKCSKILASLKGEPVYEEAVQQPEAYIRPARSDKNFRCAFGKFALCADGYALLTEEDLERCRILIKGKRFGLKKPTLWVRAFADTKYHGKEMALIAVPSLVLWEVSGITADAAQQLCGELSGLVDIPVKVLEK